MSALLDLPPVFVYIAHLTGSSCFACAAATLWAIALQGGSPADLPLIVCIAPSGQC